MSVTIDIATERVEQVFDGMAKAARHMRPALRKIRALLLRSIAANFAAGGRPRWKRRKRAYRHRILDKSGRLKRSIRGKITPAGLEVSSAVPYAATHQHGRGPIPARPFIMVQRADDAAIARIIADHLTA